MLLSRISRNRSLASIPIQTLSRAGSNFGSIDSPLVNPVFIDVALSQLLKNKNARKFDVNEFIEHYKTRMNRQNFINMLRGCRRRKVLEPRHIYTAACGLKFAEDAPLNNAQLEQIFGSISFMSHRVASVRVLLAVTSDALKECNDSFTADQLANFMFSLIQMKSGVPEVREMVSVLMMKLASCEGSMSNESASRLVGGFCGLNCKYAEVQQALSVVLSKLERSEGGDFTANQLSTALYGIKRLNADREEVRQLISFLLSKAGSTRMNGFEASQAIHAAAVGGNSDAPEAKALLQFLTQQVEGGAPLAAKSVHEVLSSLGAATANEAEVARLSAVLRGTPA